MKLRITAAIGVALAAAAVLQALRPGGAAAESPRTSAAVPDTGQAALSAMRRTLLDLASSQSMRFTGAHSYSSSLDELGFRAPRGVHVSIGEATEEGWSGSVTHDSLPGKSCVIYFGKASVPTTAGGKRPARPAALVCDPA